MTTSTTDRNKGKIHVPAEIRQRVELGGAYLDETMPKWFDIIDLERLMLNDTCRCVLGQLVRSVDPERDFFDLVTAGYVGRHLPPSELANATMSLAEAKDRGFHMHSADPDSIYDLLTVAWRQLIKRRRKEAAAQQAQRDQINAEWAVYLDSLDQDDLSVPAVLWRAADIIDSDGWTQNDWCLDGAFCAVGAIDHSSGIRDERGRLLPAATIGRSYDARWNAAMNATRAAELDGNVGIGLFTWNDSAGRSPDEVVSLFRTVALGRCDALANA
jgi:hypothetical protein